MSDVGIVQKRRFVIPHFTTQTGGQLRDVVTGYETYGELNRDRSNAVLIEHYFSSNSHAAGRYQADDAAPGYWDTVIGPGKAIDTRKFFVVAADSLVNVNAHDGRTLTTGPASVNPEMGRRYGLSFPIVTLPDFVRAHVELVRSLGIERLHAVGGASMGGLLAYEWAAAFPERVAKIFPVVAAPLQSAYASVELDLWSAAVRVDPLWRGGEYDDAHPPVEGMTMAFYNILLSARHPEYAEKMFGHRWSESDKSPMAGMGNTFLVQKAFLDVARGRAVTADANHMLYMSRANMLFTPGLGCSVDPELRKIKAETLAVACRTDCLFPPERTRAEVETLRGLGTPARYAEIDSAGGHLAGVQEMGLAGDELRRFLES